MTAPAAEVELLELPAEFRGLPYESRRDAQRWAETALPYAALVAVLGDAAEQILVQATAHYLATTGDGTGSPPEPRPSMTSTNPGQWSGSRYGDAVAAALSTHLPRASGRGRGYPNAM
jgi:hypothetical protein